MKRRSFFKSTVAAGVSLFVPDWLAQAQSLAAAGEHLAPEIKDAKTVLYACADDYAEFILCLDGKRYDEPPAITYREYLTDYKSVSAEEFKDADFLMDCQNVEIDELDKEIPEHGPAYYHYVDDWCITDSPEANAYYYVSEIMSQLSATTNEELCGINLQDCPFIGSCYRAAEVDDVLTLSCLQRALVALGEPTEIRVAQ